MSDLFDFDDKYEEDFRNTCEEICTSEPEVKTTLDGLWDLDELKGNIDDEVFKMKDELDKNKFRALKDRNMLLPQYVAELIKQNYDLFEEYNKAAASDRNKFGIAMFDIWIHAEVKKLSKDNIAR